MKVIFVSDAQLLWEGRQPRNPAQEPKKEVNPPYQQVNYIHYSRSSTVRWTLKRWVTDGILNKRQKLEFSSAGAAVAAAVTVAGGVILAAGVAGLDLSRVAS